MRVMIMAVVRHVCSFGHHFCRNCQSRRVIVFVPLTYNADKSSDENAKYQYKRQRKHYAEHTESKSHIIAFLMCYLLQIHYIIK